MIRAISSDEEEEGEEEEEEAEPPKRGGPEIPVYCIFCKKFHFMSRIRLLCPDFRKRYLPPEEAPIPVPKRRRRKRKLTNYWFVLMFCSLCVRLKDRNRTVH